MQKNAIDRFFVRVLSVYVCECVCTCVGGWREIEMFDCFYRFHFSFNSIFSPPPLFQKMSAQTENVLESFVKFLFFSNSFCETRVSFLFSFSL